MTRSTSVLALLPIVLTSLSGCATNPLLPAADAADLPRFASCDELRGSLQRQSYVMEGDMAAGMPMRSPMGMAPNTKGKMPPMMPSLEARDHSVTNVQVEGVDEADSVKTDGTYIYTLRSQELTIVRANPAENMRVATRLLFEDGSAREFYVHGTQLVVLGNGPIEIQPNRYDVPLSGLIKPMPPQTYGSFVRIYSLQGDTAPRLERSIGLEGNYVSSRMIGTALYAVYNLSPRYEADATISPVSRMQDSAHQGALAPIAPCTDVRYVAPRQSGSLLGIIGLDTAAASAAVSRRVVYGAGETIYASADNLYVARTSQNDVQPPMLWQRLGIDQEPQPAVTDIVKFHLANGAISYVASGHVPGTVLNQFSLDEYQDHLRIATTEGHVSQEGGNARNAVYVLDEQLQRSGELTNLARGERIYSARFMGARAYLVTFQKVDPLFVLDLADAANPKVMGELKIPGYSDYLHPYDETHLIGLGKDAIESSTGNFAWYQGLKLALFDVADVEHPKQIAGTVIGDRGSDSPALNDHHAFLFDRERNLLVLPVSVSEISDPEAKAQVQSGKPMQSPVYGTPSFSGAYVYNLTLTGGFQLKGKISHAASNPQPMYEKMYPGSYPLQATMGEPISRSLTIGDTIYAISENEISSHTFLDGFQDLGSVSLDADKEVLMPPTDGWVHE